MAENDETTSADDTVVQESAAEAAPDPAPEVTGPQTSGGFTARVWSFRAMVAVALASLVLGGGIGSAIAAVAGDDGPEHRVRMGRFDDGAGRGPGGELGERLRGLPDGEMREFRQELREGLDPEELEELKQLRKEMREQMRQWRDELRDRGDGSGDAPQVTPSPSAS